MTSTENSKRSRISPDSASPDIDRGWAYVVAVAIFLMSTLGCGFTYSTAVLYVVLIEEFERPASTTAWVLTINGFCTFGLGPMVSLLTNYLTTRQCIGLSGVICSGGLIASSFAQSLTTLFFTFGIVTGVGWGIGTVLAYEAIARYFVRLRHFMLTAVATGCGFGQFVFPPLFRALADCYGWRGGLFLIGGFNLNILVVAAVLMPPRAAPVDELLTLCGSEGPVGGRAPRHSLRRKLADDLSTLRRPHFALQAGGMGMSSMAVSAFQTHISNYGRCLGFGVSQFTWLPSLLGIANTVGRLALAATMQTGRLTASGLTIVGMFGVGVACMACAAVHVYYGLAALLVLFGLTTAVWALIPQVVIETADVRHLTSGSGQVLMCGSLGWLVGGPLAGLLYQADPSYVASLVGAGVAQLVAALMYVPSYVHARRGRAEMAVGL